MLQKLALARVEIALSYPHDNPLHDADAASLAVNAIFKDIRDRRVLKWMFEANGPIQVAPGMESIDPDVQIEIAETWAAIIRASYARDIA
jgi:hypothetical protein